MVLNFGLGRYTNTNRRRWRRFFFFCACLISIMTIYIGYSLFSVVSINDSGISKRLYGKESAISEDRLRWKFDSWIQDLAKYSTLIKNYVSLDSDEEIQILMDRLNTKMDHAIHEYETIQCTRNAKTDKEQFYNHVSKFGGWCAVTDDGEQYGKNVKRWASKNEQFMKHLSTTLFENKKVLEFGGGIGHEAEIYRKYGVDFYSTDGSIGIERATKGKVKYLNIASRHAKNGILPTFDWVYAMDVAEHVPEAFEEIVIGNIAMHAKEGILIQWADENRGGYGHYNPRPRQYVEMVFEEWDFYPVECEKLIGSKLSSDYYDLLCLKKKL